MVNVIKRLNFALIKLKAFHVIIKIFREIILEKFEFCSQNNWNIKTKHNIKFIIKNICYVWFLNFKSMILIMYIVISFKLKNSSKKNYLRQDFKKVETII